LHELVHSQSRVSISFAKVSHFLEFPRSVFTSKPCRTTHYCTTMALINGNFFVEDKLGTTAPHHESFQQLWETKWKEPVRYRVKWDRA
jgi:hypothetical protein